MAVQSSEKRGLGCPAREEKGPPGPQKVSTQIMGGFEVIAIHGDEEAVLACYGYLRQTAMWPLQSPRCGEKVHHHRLKASFPARWAFRFLGGYMHYGSGHELLSLPEGFHHLREP
jgi:hypothetical protein